MKLAIILGPIVAFLAVMLAGSALAASPGAILSSREVPTACSTEASMPFALDLVVKPGVHCTPSEHVHVHVGPIGVDSDLTYEKALALPSGFVVKGIHSWGAWPQWSRNGVPITTVLTSSTGAGVGSAARAKGAAFYYRRKGIASGQAVTQFPHAFAMVLHEGDVINGQVVNAGPNPGGGVDEIGMKCGPGSAPYTANGLPPAVCSTNILADNYVFPNCWDGFYAPGVDMIGTGHMSYPVNNKCPLAFPVNLPRLEQFRRSDVPAYQKGAATLDPNSFQLGGHALSEKGARHADYEANWNDVTQQAFFDQCINFRNTSGVIVGKDCGTNPPLPGA